MGFGHRMRKPLDFERLLKWIADEQASRPPALTPSRLWPIIRTYAKPDGDAQETQISG